MILEQRRGIIYGGTSEVEPAKHIDPKIFIGIDPDIDKNGVAVYDKKQKKLIECSTMRFFHLHQFLQTFNKMFLTSGYYTFIVHIEGGWLNKNNNWHADRKDNYAVRQRMANNVAQNHQAGKKIVEMCIELDIPFKVVEPLPPIFKVEAYFKKVTGWTGPTNADARSAARYVYGF